jgi:hypothetical protein
MGRMGKYNRLIINAIDNRLKLHGEIINQIKAETKQSLYYIPDH